MIDLRLGDCLEILPTIPDASVDAVITDPPYPEITREYGRWTEAQWHELMRAVVAEVRRVLKPMGSAVFVLQPNSERVGRMRVWLWEFLVWAGKEWGVVQDVYWWNYCAIPEAHSIQGRLMRPSVKMCIWCGPSDCYRDQDAVLWDESARNVQKRLSARAGRCSSPSGHGVDQKKGASAAVARGGVLPFNVLPFANAIHTRGEQMKHTAPTPLDICDWWTRYIVPSGGVICDPFMGSGTTGEAALKHGHSYIGIEKHEPYFRLAEHRLANVTPALTFA